MDSALLVLGFLIGLISGVISGAFGIGASSVKIVLMRVLLGISGSVAIATALPLSIPAAISGTVVYHKHKLIKYKTVLVAGITGAIFSVIGALATEQVSDEFLMTTMAVVLVFFAIMILWGRKEKGKKFPPQTLQEKAFYTTLIGAVAGFASGFLGIGGGVVLVPLLARLRHISYKRAIPCSLAIMLIYIVPAAITHFGLGNVDLSLFVVLFSGSAIGAWIGAQNIVKMGEAEIRKWFAITLLFFGLLLLLNELGLLP